MLPAKIFLFATTALALVVPGTDAFAQDQEGIPDIIVTAQRRDESLQQVAVAATAITGDSLQEKGVQKLDDLQRVAPGLSISDAGLTQSVNIRGIGLASGSPAVSNGVATYLDGVFQPPIVTTNSFYDIASVEVFRGPQGTFVGSNSTGGAIFINSRNPELGELGGYAELSAGNYDAIGAEGALNLPVGDTLALRGAVKYRKRDSFYDSVGSANTTAGRLDEIAGRVGALWKPTESFQALLKVEMADKETGGYAYRPFAGTYYYQFRTDDIRKLNYDTPTRNDEKAFQATLELKYEFAGGITLRSMSGYQNKRIFNLYDSDATTGLPQSTSDQYVRERMWTQEVNLISPTDGLFSWVLGGYFQRNIIDVDITNRTQGFPTDIDILTRKTTTGIFAQGTYKITPELALDVGARYSHYTASGEGIVAIGRGILSPTGIPVADLSGDHKDGRMTGKVSLNWTPDANNLVYAFVARGYKSGGFVSMTQEFKPETVLDYEIGWKSTFAGGRVRTQLGAFYYDYKNFQFDVLAPSTGQITTTNLASAKLKGIEAQIQARTHGFTFDAGLAYVDSKLANVSFIDQRAALRDFPGITLPRQCASGETQNPAICLDYAPYTRSTAGGPNLFSPKWTYNLGARYDLHLGDATVTPQVNYAYVGPQFTYIGYSPISDRISGRGLLSAQLGIAWKNFNVDIYGTNLTNKEYVTGQNGNNEFYGAPREYGVRARVNF